MSYDDLSDPHGVKPLNKRSAKNLALLKPLAVPRGLTGQLVARLSADIISGKLTPGSQLAALLGCSKIGVNSTHHQSVGRVAQPLAISAQSEDGVIEGLELKDAGQLPYLQSVQFHPERLYDRYPKFLELFHSFIRAGAREGRSKR